MRQRNAVWVIALLACGCESLLGGGGGDATPAATATQAPTLAPIATPEETATPVAEETATEAVTETETPAPRGTPVQMETPSQARTPRAASTPSDAAIVERTPKPAKTPRATPVAVETDVIDLSVETPAPTATPAVEDAFADSTPEPAATATAVAAVSDPAAGATKIASFTLPKGSDVSVVRVDASATATQTIIDVQLSGPARYKILPLPARRQVWVDLDIPATPETKTVNATGTSHVQSIGVKSFEATVRVVVQLKDDGKAFPVILPKKKGGEAASIQVRIGPDPE